MMMTRSRTMITTMITTKIMSIMGTITIRTTSDRQ